MTELPAGVVLDDDGRPQIARTPEGRRIHPDGTIGGYERLTDAARAWIVNNPRYNDTRLPGSPYLIHLVHAALMLALDEGVNYIDVEHLEAAETPTFLLEIPDKLPQ